ncbi:hypothetical protein [Micromonospora zhanjiangensis]
MNEKIVGPDDATLDHVARIQAAWARERPDLDVGPQGVIGRLHRLAGHLTEELLVVYRRHGLGEGTSTCSPPCVGPALPTNARPGNSPRTPWSPPGR